MGSYANSKKEHSQYSPQKEISMPLVGKRPRNRSIVERTSMKLNRAANIGSGHFEHKGRGDVAV